MSLSERVQQVNGEIVATVERAITELREAVSRRLHASNEEIQRQLSELTPSLPASYLSPDHFSQVESEAGAQARREAQRGLLDGASALDRARSQADILSVLLREATRHASRAALLLVRGEELRGWGSEGFAEAGEALRGLAFSPRSGGWSRFLSGAGAVRLSGAECAELCGRLETSVPQAGLVVPIVLRDRLAAALYTDASAGADLPAEALQVLSYLASQAIETLPFRERTATTTLTLDGAEDTAPAAAPVAVAPPAPQPAPAPAEPAVESVAVVNEVEVEVEAEPEPAAPAPWTAEDEASAVSLEPEPAPEPAPAPEAPWEASPRYTEELPVASIAAAAAGPAAPEAEPRYPRSVEPEPTAPVRYADPSPEATVLLQRSAVQQAAEAATAPAAAQPLRPVPVPPMPTPAEEAAPAALPGTPEVRPPSGVDGPGWAFATTRVPVSPSEETMHEEARRLARLLVSEIKLYNEEQVEEGRRNRDIYERLKEDIDRSRQMYEERVDPRILRSTDYFYQELVRILASGDSRALGI